MNIKVRRLEPDSFDRPRVQNVENNRIYADVSIGKGEWCTTSRDGEPEYPLRDDIVFTFISEPTPKQLRNGEVSRQRKWQERRKEDGLCQNCGSPAAKNKKGATLSSCDKCREKRRERKVAATLEKEKL